MPEEEERRRRFTIINVDEIVKKQIEKMARERLPEAIRRAPEGGEERERYEEMMRSEMERIISKIPDFQSIVTHVRVYGDNVLSYAESICSAPIHRDFSGEEPSVIYVRDVVDCDLIKSIITGVVFSVPPELLARVEDIVQKVESREIHPEDALEELVKLLNEGGIPVKGPYTEVVPIPTSEVEPEEALAVVAQRRPQFIKYLERLARQAREAIRRAVEEEEQPPEEEKEVQVEEEEFEQPRIEEERAEEGERREAAQIEEEEAQEEEAEREEAPAQLEEEEEESEEEETPAQIEEEEEEAEEEEEGEEEEENW